MTEQMMSPFEQLQAIDPARHLRPDESDAGRKDAEDRVLASILTRGLSDETWTGSPSGTDAVSSDFKMKKSPVRWAVPAVVGVVALVVLASIALAASPSIPNKRVIASPGASSTSWRLTATLTGPQFQIATGNPSLIAGATCTTNDLCFLSTGYGLDYNGGGALYSSKDGGHTWLPVKLPADTAITTQVSCASSTWCAVGAGRLDDALGDPLAKKPMRAPELLVTSDGGSTWTTHAVPLRLEEEQIPAGGGFPAETTYWPGSVDAVTCNAAESCQVLGQAQIDSPSGNGTADRLYYLQTADGGQNWSSEQLPEQASEADDQIVLQAGTSVSMDCPTVSACVAVASLISLPRPASESWSTDDGGRTWQEHPVPGTGSLTAPVSCPVTANCWLMTGTGTSVLHTVDGGATWSPVVVPSGDSEAISCSTTEICWASGEGIARTTDAGENWTVQSVPSPVGTVPQISCSRLGDCVATAIPANQGFAIENEGSLILTNAPVGASE
jgi:photosystem II stability/assembly factor-like uncharacterized protein